MRKYEIREGTNTATDERGKNRGRLLMSFEAEDRAAALPIADRFYAENGNRPIVLVRCYNPRAPEASDNGQTYDRALWVYDAKNTYDLNDPVTLARITDERSGG